jgi:hypothetical protein
LNNLALENTAEKNSCATFVVAIEMVVGGWKENFDIKCKVPINTRLVKTKFSVSAR